MNQRIPIEEIKNTVSRFFDLTPSGIIGTLDLLNASYQKTAAYGHFGREDHEFSWEKVKQL